MVGYFFQGGDCIERGKEYLNTEQTEAKEKTQCQ